MRPRLDMWTLATQSPSLHVTHLLPIAIIMLPLSTCASTLDVQSIGESRTVGKHRMTFYLPVTSRPCLSTAHNYPTSKSSLNLLELVAYDVDASHATDLRTRQSVTGLSLCFAGWYRVQVEGSTKYLRSILIELGVPPSGPTLHFYRTYTVDSRDWSILIS